MKPLLLPNVENPFSEKFLETWQLWQNFRKEFDNFWYKTGISQQMALKKLIDYSEGDEEKAVLIVEQSIANEWTGFYQLRNSRNKDGKSKQSTSEKSKQPPVSNTEKFKQEFMSRNGNGEQQGSSDYLKAI